MLRHSGKLLIKVSGKSYKRLLDRGLQIRGYESPPKPLFKCYQLTAKFSAKEARDNWFIASPTTFDSSHPWDIAHRAASASKYTFYAEPDLLLEARAPWSVPPDTGMDDWWPPFTSVSPCWHLLADYTGFESVRNTLGDGIRIAHLDTGYWPEHISTPKNIKPDLGWDFWDCKLSTVDPGTDWILDMPGHGTATLGLLSGNEVHLIYLGKTFDGYLGGAPNADVVPVRIGPSVIHLFTRTMAQGIDFALAAGWDPKNRCDVVSISHGGLPSVFWADAVNNVYDAGIVVVAASGDNYNLIFDFPFHETVWPSRFNRVITAVGATYDKAPYVTDDITAMQGNWGPESVMKKAIAGYTPNVPWMLFQTQNQYDMDGAGTSSSTPQIAAACALWLQLHGKQYPENWERIEACRLALFGSAQPIDPSLEKYLGRGLLNVPCMLDAARAQSIEQAVGSGKVRPTQPDDVTSVVWQTITKGAAASNEEKMYEVEAAQIIHRSTNRDLLVGVKEVECTAQPGKDVLRRLRFLLKNEPDVSSALQGRIPT